MKKKYFTNRNKNKFKVRTEKKITRIKRSVIIIAILIFIMGVGII